MSLPSCPQYLSLLHAWHERVVEMRKKAEEFQRDGKEATRREFEAAKQLAEEERAEFEGFAYEKIAYAIKFGSVQDIPRIQKEELERIDNALKGNLRIGVQDGQIITINTVNNQGDPSLALQNIFMFRELKELRCFNTKITTLPKLPDGLKVLTCYKTQLTTLPRLPDTLTTLNCSQTQIISLPELPDQLTRLDCNDTQLVTLPKLPDGLKWLDCFNTPLTTLPELPDGISWLDCVNTKITTMPKLPDSLKHLSCGSTNITSLPTLPKGLTVLACSNTKISSLPELPPNLTEIDILKTPAARSSVVKKQLAEYSKHHPSCKIQY